MIYIKKVKILLLCCFFGFVQNSQIYSQNMNKETPFQFVYEDTNQYAKYISINFIDTITKEILYSFNMLENNPFNKLAYPEVNIKAPDEKNKVYQINNVPLENITLPEGKLVLKKQLENSEQYTELIGSSFYQATEKGNYLVVKYNFYLTFFDIVVGRSDAIFIFDQKGNLLYELNDFDTNVREWALTENGKYFSYATGSSLDEWSGSFCEVGYKIIDLQKNKITYEDNFGYEYSEIRTRSFNNMIKVSCHSINFLYVLFDFSKNKKYSRYFSRDEMNLWKKFTKNGLLIYVGNRKSGTYELLSYENDFKVEDIK